jgi:hypothetical protein
VLAPTRRPLAEHPHLENPVGDPAVFLPQLAGRVDIAFCCLGTTSSRRARKSLPRGRPGHGRGLQQTCPGNGRAAPAGDQRMGADPKSSIFYNRVKGEMEEALKLRTGRS